MSLLVPLWEENIIFVCYHHHYTIVASEIVSDWTYVYVARVRINLYLNCRDILPECSSIVFQHKRLMMTLRMNTTTVELFCPEPAMMKMMMRTYTRSPETW